MGLIDWLRGDQPEQVPIVEPSELARRELSFDQFVSYFTHLGNTYPFQVTTSGQLGSEEKVGRSFGGYAGAFRSNVVVFACIAWRMRVASEIRFQFQRIVSGRPSDLFGSDDLRILEQPWPGGTTGDLIARVVLDIDLAGNSFTLLRGTRLVRLRPDWVTIVYGNPRTDANMWDPDTVVDGYLYQPGGPVGGEDRVYYPAESVAHVAPYPDPISPARGVPWIDAVLTDVDADQAASTHKLKFFQNGATIAQTIVLEGIEDPDEFNTWIETFNEAHQGVENAYKILFLTAGAKPFPTGTTLEQQSFKVTQGGGETRIAMASGIHPVVLGASEGLQGSALNAGNYATARRSTADNALRPLWRNIAGSFQRIIRTPGNARLWYDERDVAFLREDQKDAAEIQAIQVGNIASLVKEGFEPDDAVIAVTSGDLKLLKGKHEGLVSVQLQPRKPEDRQPNNEPPEPSPNGNGGGRVPAELREE